jgi:NAD-dependent DNA ligase
LHSIVKKETNFIVVGKGAGSKLTAANARGIPILFEHDFLEQVEA